MEGNSNSMCSFRDPLSKSYESNGLFSLEEIEQKIQQLITENTELRMTLQQNNTYMRQLSSTLVEWQDDVLRARNGYQNEVQKAKDIILKLKEENAVLKQKINLVDGTSSQSTSNNESLFPFRSDSVQQEGLESFDSYVLVSPPSNQQATNEHQLQQKEELPSYDSLFQKNENEKELKEDAEKSLCRVQREADFLRAQLASEMESNKKKQVLLAQTQDQLDKLMLEYQELSKKLGTIQESQLAIKETGPTNEEFQELTKANLILRRKFSELEEQANSANLRLAIAEEMVLSKQVDISELQSEIDRLEKSLETMPILTAQMEQFRNDFEAEREARQNLAGQKDAMEQEIRLLKRQLEGAVESSYVSVSTTNAQEVEVATYMCPKCSFKYQSNEALNNHLDVCLNQPMYP